MLTTLRDAWRKLRGWRRIRFTVGGAVFSVGSLAIGFAAVDGILTPWAHTMPMSWLAGVELGSLTRMHLAGADVLKEVIEL